MLMVSSSVSASQSVDSAVFQMSQCLAKIRIVIQNRWSCLRTKQSLMQGDGRMGLDGMAEPWLLDAMLYSFSS